MSMNIWKGVARGLGHRYADKRKRELKRQGIAPADLAPTIDEAFPRH